MLPVFDKNGHATVAGEIRVYYFDPLTHEFTGMSDEYIYEGVSIPGNSTAIEPANAEDGAVMVFTGAAWESKEDHRGETVYSTGNQLPVIVDYIGPVRDGFTLNEPTTAFDLWNGDTWVTDTASQHAHDIQTAEATREQLIGQANDHMNNKQWPGKAALGRLKEAEKEQYNSWLDYLDALEAVDTSSAPQIEWPSSPGVN